MSNLSPQMTPSLQSILEAELAHGNEVLEVTNWPPKCALLVILKRRFHNAYELSSGIEYAEINDSHYWQAEYRFKNGLQTLACGFK